MAYEALLLWGYQNQGAFIGILQIRVRNRIFMIVLICTVLLLGALWYFSTSDSSLKEVVVLVPENALYLDASQPLQIRVENLLSYMTLQEKIGQMALVEKNSVHDADDIVRYGLGGMLSGFGGKPEENTPQGWEAMVGSFTQKSKESRLGIPLLYGADAIHGHTNVPGATVFPHAIGLGATNDADLVEAIGEATARELKATNIFWNFAPNLDLPQDIRWGRVFETFGDDPVVASELGRAYIRGLQKKDTPGAAFVLATPKHFIGAGGMVLNTSSNKDYLIDQGTTEGSEALLREVYLPPFKASLEEGVESILIGLNSWGDEKVNPEDFKVNDILKKEWGFEGELVDKINRKVHEFLFTLRGLDNQKLSANEYLISDVLKSELGFKGFAVSDWYGVYEVPGGDYKAAVRAINAGIDMVMLPFDYKAFVTNVTKAVQKGEIEESRIDDAVRRILRAKFVAGLFDERSSQSLEVLGSEEHRALARTAVAQSAVLLKNEGNILPLRDTIPHIRVAGSAADNVGMQSGGWTIEWQGVDGNVVPGGTSILQGITKRVHKNTVVEYDELGNFESKELADIGIAVVGETPYAEGWGDRALPILGAEDLQTIERLKASSKKVVVIVISGRPLLITGELSKWNALVAAWLPGGEGGGIADVLFGDVPFTGTLPLPWPAYSEQLPIAPDGTTTDGTHVLFPRGYKLP